MFSFPPDISVLSVCGALPQLWGLLWDGDSSIPPFLAVCCLSLAGTLGMAPGQGTLCLCHPTGVCRACIELTNTFALCNQAYRKKKKKTSSWSTLSKQQENSPGPNSSALNTMTHWCAFV